MPSRRLETPFCKGETTPFHLRYWEEFKTHREKVSAFIMPTFQEYCERVVQRLKREGSRGLTHDELRSIALEIGWIYKTAHRRAYHVKNILEASGLLAEIEHEYQQNSMRFVTDQLLKLLKDRHQISQVDLDELARKLGQDHLLSSGIEADFQEPLMECIEILEGTGVLIRRGNTLVYNHLRHQKLQDELHGTVVTQD